jgi:hypothetical protein
MTNQEAATFIVKSFIRNGEIHSCDNCDSWNRQKHICDKFGVTPPIEVILYSCGKGWCLDIPF